MVEAAFAYEAVSRVMSYTYKFVQDPNMREAYPLGFILCGTCSQPLAGETHQPGHLH